MQPDPGSASQVACSALVYPLLTFNSIIIREQVVTFTRRTGAHDPTCPPVRRRPPPRAMPCRNHRLARRRALPRRLVRRHQGEAPRCRHLGRCPQRRRLVRAGAAGQGWRTSPLEPGAVARPGWRRSFMVQNRTQPHGLAHLDHRLAGRWPDLVRPAGAGPGRCGRTGPGQESAAAPVRRAWLAPASIEAPPTRAAAGTSSPTAARMAG